MKNEISSNYLLNKYSYCLFIAASVCFYKLILKQYDLKIFIILEAFLLIAYLFWLCTTGSYHFGTQVRVFRNNQSELKVIKNGKTFFISNSEIDQICFYPVIFMKGNKITIKIKITIYTKEEFFYHIKISRDGLDISRIYDSSYLYTLTNNFWGIVDKEKIKLATSIFLA